MSVLTCREALRGHRIKHWSETRLRTGGDRGPPLQTRTIAVKSHYLTNRPQESMLVLIRTRLLECSVR